MALGRGQHIGPLLGGFNFLDNNGASCFPEQLQDASLEVSNVE